MKRVRYVTKKQVDLFIDHQIERLKTNRSELLKEVNIVLNDLNDYPEDHPNQIKFYTKVAQRLS